MRAYGLHKNGSSQHRNNLRRAQQPVEYLGRITISDGLNGDSAGLASRRLSYQVASWDRSQIRDTNLRCASLSPSM
jgi:hypothetical protein